MRAVPVEQEMHLMDFSQVKAGGLELQRQAKAPPSGAVMAEAATSGLAPG